MQSDMAALKFVEAVKQELMVVLSASVRRAGHLPWMSASQASSVLRAVTNSCSPVPASTSFPSHLGLSWSRGE